MDEASSGSGGAPAHDALDLVLRHEYGRVVAALLREFGGARLALIEDGLAQAMLEALGAWTREMPPSPRAWLHRAARHRIIDELRRARRFASEAPLEDEPASSAEVPDAALSDDVHDDELRALYACADPSIPLPSQIAFALRTLAGFSTREIAARLVTSEENVQKRYERAREGLRQVDFSLEPTGEALRARTDAVLRMLYVLFTEGYFASSGDAVLKLELCREAIRLTALVAAHPRLGSRDALALLALMHLHHARRDARVDASGKPVLLEDQDRRAYRQDELLLGLRLLQRASASETGEVVLSSSHHLEAAIAAEHGFAPSFAATRWEVITQLYDRLAEVSPSPLHALHAAVAASYASGPDAGLARLSQIRPPTWLAGSHLWLATHADLEARAGRLEEARAHYDQAIALAPPIERHVLELRRDARTRGDG